LGKKHPPIIGLDIGASSIRLLQLSRHGSSFRIDHFAIEPLPQGVIVEKSVQDIDAISGAIKSAIRKSGSSSKCCAVAVSGSAVFTKTISLPANLAQADIESQVQIEANRIFPIRWMKSAWTSRHGPSARNADMVDILLAASKTRMSKAGRMPWNRWD
jgi:type IV pilus assembly protein PilM